MNLERVLSSIRQELEEEVKASALLVTIPANVRYLSNFSSPADGQILITKEKAILLTDGRYTAQAEVESTLEVIIRNKPNWFKFLAEELLGNCRIAFEADHLTYYQVEQFTNELTKKNRAPPIPTRKIVTKHRLYKSPKELEAISQAAKITDDAFSYILNYIKADLSEIEVALEIERFIRKSGAEDKAFEIIVASGVRSSMPHGSASQKLIKQGELVTLDFGAKVDGYFSDMTRTVAIGEISDELKAMYQAVLEAQEIALTTIEPNKTGKEVDNKVREVLKRHELEQYFPHGLGHGVGLEVHENPRMSRYIEHKLEEGMTVTVEPGVYIPNKAGVRIEDLVVITKTGCRRLSNSEKQLIYL